MQAAGGSRRRSFPGSEESCRNKEKKRKISGDHFLLTGDAASLIDPFTGEGIGNGMISGMIAAEQIQQAIHADRYDAAFLSSYDKKIYEALWSELKLSRKLQGFAKYE